MLIFWIGINNRKGMSQLGVLLEIAKMIFNHASDAHNECKNSNMYDVAKKTASRDIIVRKIAERIKS